MMHCESALERTVIPPADYGGGNHLICATAATTADSYDAAAAAASSMQLLTSASPVSAEARILVDSDHNKTSNTDAVFAASRRGSGSSNSSCVSARLKRYAWRAVLAVVSVITALAVIAGQTLLGASLTNAEQLIENVKADVRSMLSAGNGRHDNGSSSSSGSIT